MENIEIFEYLHEYGNAPALAHGGKVYTYKNLVDAIEEWEQKLASVHFPAVVGIESDFSIGSISLIFFLIKKNAIIVPFDIKQKNKNLSKYEIAAPDYIIRIESENYFSIEQLDNAPARNDYYSALINNNLPGLVLFTSGSSGTPKAAVHDFSKLLKKFNKKRKTFVTVNFLLFDHWGGLNTMLHILSNAGLLVILEDRTPDHVCEMIDKYSVELLPVSPTFLNMLLISRAYQRWSLKTLKLITYGAEPMPESLLAMVGKIFPDIKLQQTYGLIELGVLNSKSESNGSLWVKVGGEGYQLRVVNDMLEIKSESAMLGYINASSPFTEDGWFKTGDAVEVKGEFLRILGRKSELINVGGEKVFPQEVENVILELSEVLDVVVFGQKNPLTGNIVCARVYAAGDHTKESIIKIVKTHCRSRLASFKVPVKVTVETQGFENTRFKKERLKWT